VQKRDKGRLFTLSGSVIDGYRKTVLLTRCSGSLVNLLNWHKFASYLDEVGRLSKTTVN
jgi:hypothetical protein